MTSQHHKTTLSVSGLFFCDLRKVKNIAFRGRCKTFVLFLCLPTFVSPHSAQNNVAANQELALVARGGRWWWAEKGRRLKGCFLRLIYQHTGRRLNKLGIKFIKLVGKVSPFFIFSLKIDWRKKSCLYFFRYVWNLFLPVSLLVFSQLYV